MTVDPQKLLAVQVVREIHRRGGKATLHNLTSGRDARRRVKHALQLACRERLVTSGDGGETWAITDLARDLIAAHPAEEEQAA